MTISDVSICNHALDLIGADPILSIDDDTRAGRLCRRNYERCRDAVLRAYPWNPAIRRASLPALSDAPAWGFLFHYALPEGPEPPYCLRVLQLEGEIDGRSLPYRIEGRRILTNDGPPLSLLYVGRASDPNEFGPLLADTISARLAAELSYALAGSASLAETLARSYRDKLAEARAIDAQEGTPDRFTATEWLESRT
ncbi:MAG: hypothetical protein AB7J30_13030 [Hyphomicrobium sp.]|jgi:hypothetical protein|uniref:hypothetical protein n=1 Tax=Hyphomicrobium sp. TaxID=82 RepID=UPI003D0A301C